jgi:hypothetical protein
MWSFINPFCKTHWPSAKIADWFAAKWLNYAAIYWTPNRAAHDIEPDFGYSFLP